MSHHGDCDHLIFWQFPEVKKLAPLTQESPPTYELSIRGQSKILPGNLGMKMDCTEEELENFRLRHEHFYHMPLPSIAEGNRSRAIVDRSFDDEEETDSYEYPDEEPDDPAPSIRSP
jgi:hypothetical protein